jgi:hypothetical protein
MHGGVALALMLAMAAPSPSAAPAQRPLREIGHVRALTPECRRTIEHADAAIGTALDNDSRIAVTIANLRALDLDSTTIKKVEGTRLLQRYYTDMRAAAGLGEAEVKQLRSDAEKDDARKAELRRFADALGAAVAEQKKVAEKLGSYVAYLDSHRPIDDNERAQMLNDIQLAQTDPHSRMRGDPRDYLPPTLTELARTAADRLGEQQALIAAHEAAASDRIDAAFKGCL